MEARRAHNPEVGGSKPLAAKKICFFLQNVFDGELEFYFNCFATLLVEIKFVCKGSF